MDPMTLGFAVITSMVAPLTKNLLERATDPENVAKAVNWVFNAADNFLKIRNKEHKRDRAIPPPPNPASTQERQVKVDDLEVEDKKEAVEKVAKYPEEDIQDRGDVGLLLMELDEFAMDQLEKDVKHILQLLETYLGNLRHEEHKASDYGGLKHAPIIVRNMILNQQNEIAKLVRRLNKAMAQAYGASAPDLDILILITST